MCVCVCVCVCVSILSFPYQYVVSDIQVHTSQDMLFAVVVVVACLQVCSLPDTRRSTTDYRYGGSFTMHRPCIAHALLTYPIRACIEARLLRATGLYAFDPFDFQASIRDVLVCKPGFYPRLYGSCIPCTLLYLTIQHVSCIIIVCACC